VSGVPTNGRQVLAEFELPSAPGNEREAIERVATAVAAAEIEPARLDRLKTAVGEATMNAMEHGNQYRADLAVSIRVLRDADALRVQVTDHGDAGEPATPEVPDIEAKLDGRQSPRGWGLFLIKEMVDETLVTTDDGLHTLELVVHLRGDRDGHE
ncbi:MAG: ATP-binding protein, partial [Actinomycetota bacterium]|nr:ATP-binding protein [Actinomycetota bacterium]